MPEIIADNISVIQSSELEGATRLDAEHYQKEYITLKNRLVSIGSVPLSNLISSNVITGHTPSMKKESFYGGSINFIKTDNLRENQITKDFNHFLTDTGNKQILRSSLKEKDVIVTIIGATFDIISRACLITKEILPANINQNIALIRVNEKILPEYLNIYLNTKFGRKYLHYLSRQTEQVNLCCREVEQLLVPFFSMNFQSQIKELLDKSNKLFNKSKNLYSQAEALLFEGLGIKDIDLSHEPCYEVNSADTITANRIDAEYYQPKYERIIEAIKKHDHKEFWEIAFVDKTANPPYSKQKDIPIITQKHLGYYQIDEEFLVDPETEYTTAQFTKQYSKYVLQKEDILLYSVGAYIGKANIFNLDIKAVSGSFLTIIRIDKTIINPYYLLAVLNSLTGVSQSKRHSKATAQQYLYPADIRKFVIPILKKTIQEEIGQFIVDANYARRQAKELLEEAKKKVEEMIEKGQKD